LKPLCLVMAGGRSSRFGGRKLVEEVCGEPLIDHPLAASEKLCSYTVIAVSRHTMEDLKSRCSRPLAECIETSGRDYIDDLSLALAALRKPVLVLPGDAVFKDVNVLRRFVEEAFRLNVDVVTMVVSGLGPVGVSFFRSEGGSWADIVVNLGDVVDVDTREMVPVAEDVCKGGQSPRG